MIQATERTKPRFPKSAIAAITAGGILLGGGVTYSLWSDNADGSGTADIYTGELSIVASGSTSVVEVVGSTKSAVTDAFRAVPGETFEISQAFTVTLTGDHINAELGLDYSGVDFGDLEGFEITGMTLTDPEEAAVTLNSGAAEITESGTYSAVFTMVFDADNKVDQNEHLELSLEDITATLTQIAPH